MAESPMADIAALALPEISALASDFYRNEHRISGLFRTIYI
jgi:hypothetical protein